MFSSVATMFYNNLVKFPLSNVDFMEYLAASLFGSFMALTQVASFCLFI